MRRKKGSRGHIDSPIRTVVVNRKEYPIHVNGDGDFYAHVAGDYIKADTLKAVMDGIKRAAKKLTVKIDVPVTVLGLSRHEGSKWYRRSIGDVHSGSIFEFDSDEHIYRVRFTDGGVDTIEQHSGRYEIARPMSKDEIKEWERLRKARDEAESKFNDYERRFEFKDLHSKVKAAYNAAIDTPREDDETEATGDPRIDGVQA